MYFSNQFPIHLLGIRSVPSLIKKNFILLIATVKGNYTIRKDTVPQLGYCKDVRTFCVHLLHSVSFVSQCTSSVPLDL